MIEFIKYHFDSAHRLSNYKGKCKNIHGHRWDIEVFVKGEVGERSGMIIDFTEIKKIIDKFDHITILRRNNENKKIASLFNELNLDYILIDDEPTAENLAIIIYNNIISEIGRSYHVRIKLWESPGCCVEYGNKIED